MEDKIREKVFRKLSNLNYFNSNYLFDVIFKKPKIKKIIKLIEKN